MRISIASRGLDTVVMLDRNRIANRLRQYFQKFLNPSVGLKHFRFRETLSIPSLPIKRPN